MKNKVLLLSIALLQGNFAIAQKPIYLDRTKSVEERIEDALSRMTLSEKLKVIHAQSKFSSAGIPRLGFPDFWTSDGPHGIRTNTLWDEWTDANQTNDSCVAFPALTCLAATWNPKMAYLFGRSLGEEARYRGKDMVWDLASIFTALHSMVATSNIWAKTHIWPDRWQYHISKAYKVTG